MTTVDALQCWYEKQCDGEWEHQHGIVIETLDNPGWRVKIDLVGTELQTCHFASIAEGCDNEGWQQSHQWMHCVVRDSTWYGAGDERSLGRILSTFLTWAGVTKRGD